MNTAILQQYGLQFYKLDNGQCRVKGTGNLAWLSTYVYIYRDIDDLSDFISDLDLAISGNINQIEDTDYGGWYGSYFSAEIATEGMIIWQSSWEDRTIIPLVDMKEILLSWKEFIE